MSFQIILLINHALIFPKLLEQKGDYVLQSAFKISDKMKF